MPDRSFAVWSLTMRPWGGLKPGRDLPPATTSATCRPSSLELVREEPHRSPRGAGVIGDPRSNWACRGHGHRDCKCLAQDRQPLLRRRWAGPRIPASGLPAELRGRCVAGGYSDPSSQLPRRHLGRSRSYGAWRRRRSRASGFNIGAGGIDRGDRWTALPMILAGKYWIRGKRSSQQAPASIPTDS